METNPSGKVSYTIEENSLSTSVSELLAYLSRNSNVSDISTEGGDQKGSHKEDGTINTGYIPNCR